MKASCLVISKELQTNSREEEKNSLVQKTSNSLEIVYNYNDTLEEFEYSLNELCGNSSFFYKMKKRGSAYFLSFISVVVILFALISSSLYEDIVKKVIFESPFPWSSNDTISILFVLLFFFGLILMPSILDGEGSEFKESLKAWINKDIRVLKRLKVALNSLDKKYKIKIYNIDLLEENHWMWRLVMPIVINHFSYIEIYVRNDLKKRTQKRVKALGCLSSDIKTTNGVDKPFLNYELFFSQKEETLYSLMQLSSTKIIGKDEQDIYISLELFEYCGRNFYDQKSEKNQLISGFQNFVNRCFDDFKLLNQHKSNQIFFQKWVKIEELEDERRRLSYYLRNHIEECLEYFDNPISLLILYYYVKDIVLDEKRTIAILEKLIDSIKRKQQYDLINNYWFKIAGEMFDSNDLDSFILTNNSIYRKLSIETLNSLIFLFERNGKFEQALLIAKYLYEINPNKYSIDISSLYERLGEFDKAYNSLVYNAKDNTKPNDVEVRYYQRKSWIVVSQRKEEKREEGKEALGKLYELLFSHKEFNEPLWLWHYYNIKANYEEWDENFDLTIDNYLKCLSIPALGAFEYGATFVNTSIAYRLNYIKSKDKNIELISKSIELGFIGIKLKESVGDRDEMPVVLHNQCLNILYKLVYFEDKKLLDSAMLLVLKAYAILSETKSKKRLGMILTELILLKAIKNEPYSKELEELEKHWINMNNYEKTQAYSIYSLYEGKNIVKRVEWLTI
ncbi:hypothetical protein [Halarcobacter ebronensis]|uniref:Uncharacterized protein n=1 Tax=Halarcobacter ebronensis TaxID=1462615 RepID=A0A4Q1ARH3_9BACT|nr:hypothetical protein [Halarcobacter ebronensis]QKF82214.1 putative membrane protein [Halarcobacter ebronensis]RXK03410.1 hypothetical protein CRV07_12065 [Halarcobacter ebronensis]